MCAVLNLPQDARRASISSRHAFATEPHASTSRSAWTSAYWAVERVRALPRSRVASALLDMAESATKISASVPARGTDTLTQQMNARVQRFSAKNVAMRLGMCRAGRGSTEPMPFAGQDEELKLLVRRDECINQACRAHSARFRPSERA